MLLSPQKVAILLRKEGIPRSEYVGTGRKQFRKRTEGYYLITDDAFIEVYYQVPGGWYDKETLDAQTDGAKKVFDILNGAGIECTLYSLHVKCRRNKEE